MFLYLARVSLRYNPRYGLEGMCIYNFVKYWQMLLHNVCVFVHFLHQYKRPDSPKSCQQFVVRFLTFDNLICSIILIFISLILIKVKHCYIDFMYCGCFFFWELLCMLAYFAHFSYCFFLSFFFFFLETLSDKYTLFMNLCW